MLQRGRGKPGFPMILVQQEGAWSSVPSLSTAGGEGGDRGVLRCRVFQHILASHSPSGASGRPLPPLHRRWRGGRGVRTASALECRKPLLARKTLHLRRAGGRVRPATRPSEGVTKRSAGWGCRRLATRNPASVPPVRARPWLPVCPAARGAASGGRPPSQPPPAGGRSAVPSPSGGESGRGRGGIRRGRTPHAPETRSAARGVDHAKPFSHPPSGLTCHLPEV